MGWWYQFWLAFWRACWDAYTEAQLARRQAIKELPHEETDQIIINFRDAIQRMRSVPPNTNDSTGQSPAAPAGS